jgi:hypothetical protein
MGKEHLADLGGCEDNIKMNLGETGYEGMDWTELARDLGTNGSLLCRGKSFGQLSNCRLFKKDSAP